MHDGSAASWASVCDKVDKCYRKRSSSHRVTFDVAELWTQDTRLKTKNYKKVTHQYAVMRFHFQTLDFSCSTEAAFSLIRVEVLHNGCLRKTKIILAYQNISSLKCGQDWYNNKFPVYQSVLK